MLYGKVIGEIVAVSERNTENILGHIIKNKTLNKLLVAKRDMCFFFVLFYFYFYFF